MKITEHSMRFGAFKKRKMAEEQEEIERSISALEKHIIDGHTDDSETTFYHLTPSHLSVHS